MCGVDPKTVKRKVLAHEAGELEEERAGRAPVARNTDVVRELVAKRGAETRARVSAKRLLPAARAAGYVGSPRNFRRLVAAQKRAWRAVKARQRRPAVWVPGETLVIDWGRCRAGSGGSVRCRRGAGSGSCAADVRSILAIGAAAPEPAAAGDVVVVDLPAVEVRGFDA